MLFEDEKREDFKPQTKIDLGGGEVIETDLETDPVDNADPQGESATEGATGQSVKYSEDFLRKYKEKSKEELLDVLHNQEKMIGRQASEIGKQRQIDGEVKTYESVKKEASELRKSLDAAQRELEDMDSIVDGEDYTKKQKEVKDLQDRYERLDDEMVDLRIDEKLDRKYNADFNNEFFEKTRSSYQRELGLDFDEGDWEAITKLARELNGTGKMTPESVEAAVIRSVGAAEYRKMLTSQGEINMREKISRATDNATKLLGDKGQGASGPISIESLSDRDFDRVVNRMTPDQFKKLGSKMGFQVK